MAQVHLSVPDDVKENWKEYKDESDTHTTLSGLVRSAVESQHGESEVSGTDAYPQNVDDEMAEIHDAIESLTTEIREVKRLSNDVEQLKETAEVLAERTERIQSHVQPSQEDITEKQKILGYVPDEPPKPPQERYGTPTAARMAERIDEMNASEVQYYLSQADQDDLIVSEKVNGTLYYWQDETAERWWDDE